MGGPSAPDDVRLGHLTREWLATGDEGAVRSTGGFWHHQRRVEPAPAVNDRSVQDELLARLAEATGERLPGAS
jgi:hypothetical protein